MVAGCSPVGWWRWVALWCVVVSAMAGPVNVQNAYFTGFNFTDMALKAIGNSRMTARPQIVTIGPNTKVDENEYIDEADDGEAHHDAWMRSGKYQGDIINEDAVDGFEANDATILQQPYDNAVRNTRARWPNGVIPYVIDRIYGPRSRGVILKALNSFAERTDKCIQFVPRTNQRDYIYIQAGYGCYSHVGRTGGRQSLSLGRGCLYHSVAVHEMMHAVGFWHEQSRSDRDSHIRILWNNVQPGTAGNFAKINPSIQTLLGEPYDFQSVMHYQSRAFSRNGQRTIEALNPAFTRYLGTAKQASDLDLLKIKKLYGCPTSEPVIPEPSPLPTTTSSTMRPRTSRATTAAPTTTSTAGTLVTNGCRDEHDVCAYIKQYCFLPYISFVMQSSCAFTCGYCN